MSAVHLTVFGWCGADVFCQRWGACTFSYTKTTIMPDFDQNFSGVPPQDPRGRRGHPLPVPAAHSLWTQYFRRFGAPPLYAACIHVSLRVKCCAEFVAENKTRAIANVHSQAYNDIGVYLRGARLRLYTPSSATHIHELVISTQSALRNICHQDDYGWQSTYPCSYSVGQYQPHLNDCFAVAFSMLHEIDGQRQRVDCGWT